MDRDPAISEPELTVVMPVFNEEGAVTGVIADWTGALAGMGIDFRLAVYDDGSRDGTERTLQELARLDPRLLVVRHANRGHGPTILRGYREAQGRWILQVDSDGEMAAGHFAALWREREAYDFLVGARQDRVSAPLRRLVSAGSRASVHALLGRGVRDVNSPYRLMRRDLLRPLLDLLPADPFAPNVLLSGLAARAGLRVFECSIPHEGRRVGTGSLTRWRLWAGIARSFWDTVRTAVRVTLGR
jgi:dolichol-phosphate mannosyltransferase